MDAGRPSGCHSGRRSCTARTTDRGSRPPGVSLTPPTSRSNSSRTLSGTSRPSADLDGVLPAVAEVVEVLEPGRQVSQPRRGLVLDLEVGPVRVRHAVAHTVGHELVQMAVRPTEC